MEPIGGSLQTERERLRAENTALRERLRHVERSRWWRLNPRRLVTRVASFRRRWRFSAHAPGPSASQQHESRPPRDDQLARFRREIVDEGTFSKDWFTRHIATWEPILADLDGRSARVLEIGSYEGLSSCFLLWRLPDARVTCVDTFAGGAEHHHLGLDLRDLEARFDANVALFGGERVRKRAGDSRHVLLDLHASDETFDLVYIDGSHEALDVIVDAALAWRLLVPGGVMIFDDYTWGFFGDRLRRPAPAIDAFVDLVGEDATTLFSDQQLALAKRTTTIPDL